MAQIPTYDEHIVPQGSIQAQATPNDFGANVGQGMQQVAGGLNAVSDTAFKIEQDQGRIWAYDASSKAYTNLRQGLSTQINALDPNDPNFTSKASSLTDDFSKQIDDTTTDLMGQAPSKSARKILQSHMAMNGKSLLNIAIGEQSRIAGEYTGKLITDGIKSDQDQVAADPSDDNFNRVLQNRSDSIGSLTTVDPVAKMKWQSQLEHGLAITQVQTIAATNPQGFLASINAQGGHTSVRSGAVKGAVPGGAPDPDAAIATPVAPQPADNSRPLGTPPQAAAVGSQLGVAPTEVDPGKTAAGVQAAVQMTPAQVAHEDAYDRSPANLTELRAQIERYKGDPAKSAILQAELTNLTTTPGAPMPAGAAAAGVQVASLDPSAGLPQVMPLTDQAISASAPAIAGWGKLTWQEKVTAVRQAEASVGGDLATARGQMDRDLRDASTSLLAGKSFDGLDSPRFGQESLTRLYGTVDGPRKFDSLQYTKQVGGFINQMATMPVAQAADTLKNLEPQGGPEYADKAPVYHAAAEAFVRLEKLRGDDFMQWALNNKVGGAQPLDTSSPDKFADSLHARIAVAQSGVNDYGTNAGLLSKGEVAGVQGSLEQMNPAQQMAYISAIRTGTAGHDEWFNDVLGQIAPKNTTFAQAAQIATRNGNVQTAAGAQDSNTVGQYVLEGARILQGRDLGDVEKTGRPLALDDKAVRGFFWNAVGADAFSSLDAPRSAQAAADTYQSVKNYLAADMYHRGLNPTTVTSDQVANAVKAVTGGTTDGPNGSKLFLPWGMTDANFQKTFLPRAQGAIAAAGLGGSALDKLDAYKFTNVGDGKYGFMNGNKMLVGADGRTVLVDYSKPFGPRQGGGAVQ